MTAIMMNYLKSNMDRFIDEHGHLKKKHLQHLKSNMDRFIATPNISVQTQHIDLKSNMDRFIARVTHIQPKLRLRFKIQYG